jgi:tRNA(Met) cytidine acetyltransferase
MTPTAFFYWFSEFQRYAEQQRHRHLVVLAGDKSWAFSLLTAIKSIQKAVDYPKWSLFSDDNLSVELLANFSSDNQILTNKNYRYFLGTQCQTLIFADTQLSIDAFAALSGTICAGGTLFLLWPESLENSKAVSDSLFLQRFFKQLQQDNDIVVIEQTAKVNPLPAYKARNTLAKSYPEAQLLDCKTRDQLKAVNAIKKVLTGRRNRPLVLTADRGRGKSSALAIACAQLLTAAKKPLNILISAPHQQALQIFFQQLQTSLPTLIVKGSQLTYQHYYYEQGDKKSVISTLAFVAVDFLLKNKPKASLLLIDEAAAIPVYLLEGVITHYHRVVFATTMHGYEGAGRGFSLKFQRSLQKQQPDWQALHLNEPIRWAENDPLERFVFSSCLLAASLENITTDEFFSESSVDYKTLTFTRYRQQELAHNENLLAKLFSVLVTAHYQTSPSDLMLILDNKQVDIVSLSCQQTIVAVALLIHEGECESQAVTAIKHAKRRLKNQFLPQSLINHCGFEQAFDYRYLRIMRIAVHPNFQQQGIGRYFVDQLTEYAKSQAIDFLGTSFGANAQLLNFWLQADFYLTRIGFSKDQASGEYSALLLKKITTKAEQQLKGLNQEFYRSFTFLLADEYQQLATDLIQLILQYQGEQNLILLTTFDINAVDAFANKSRLYSSCVFSLHLWLLEHLSKQQRKQEHNKTNNKDVLPLIARILQKHSPEQVCARYQLSGKKALNQYLIDYLSKNIKKNLS